MGSSKVLVNSSKKLLDTTRNGSEFKKEGNGESLNCKEAVKMCPTSYGVGWMEVG